MLFACSGRRIPSPTRKPGPAPGAAWAGRLQSMRILVFSLYFQPDPTGTGLILGELTRDLAKRGHDVTVVTTVTHYGLEGPVAGYRGRLIFDETEISVDDVEQIQRLAFVFMNTLDLDIKERIGGHVNAGGLGNTLGQAHFIGSFHVHKRLLKRRVLRLVLEIPEGL